MDPVKEEAGAETFEEFKNSFSYGSRTDLTFKFLKKLPPPLAAEALQEILAAIGASFDSGDVEPLHELVVRWQVAAYTPAADAPRTYTYEEAPFAPLAKPLSESKVALVASSGHYAAGDDPQPFGVAGMTQSEATDRIGEFLRETPVMSEIPRRLPADQLRVRHGGYDTRSTLLDHNVTFPVDALAAAEASGRIGELADPLYSFPGATSQGRLRKRALPSWLDAWRAAEVDVLLLVPV